MEFVELPHHTAVLIIIIIITASDVLHRIYCIGPIHNTNSDHIHSLTST